MPIVGENIKRIRNERGFTQKELSKKIGTTQQNLAQYENGKRNPKRETLIKIANALDVTEQELLDFPDGSYRLYMAYDEAEPNETGPVVGTILVTQQNLLRQYNKLNTYGKSEAIKRIKELQYIPEYTTLDDIPFD